MTVGRIPSVEGGIQPTIFDAKADLLTATAADTPARLAVGANDTVLTADSSTATGLKWAAAAGGGANWSLLNTGGTALTGASTITVSGISGKDKIMVLIDNASMASGGTVTLRFNGDSDGNYYRYGNFYYFAATYAATNFARLRGASSGLVLGNIGTSASSALAGYCLMTGANSSGVKVYNLVGQGGDGVNGEDNTGYSYGGYYDSSSTISSVSVVAASNFDAGTVFVYTSA
jgi:hypothetical protein